MTVREQIISRKNNNRESKPIFDDKGIIDDFCGQIVLAAVDDWRNYRKGCEKYIDDPDYNGQYERRLKAVEKFFLSDWFKMLTKINGKWLITKLEEDFLEDNPSALASAC